MATAGINLSDYDASKLPNVISKKIGVLVSEWNPEITNALAKGAIDTLLQNNIPASHIAIEHVPGAFELPSAANMMLASNLVDAVICIGSVIRGETEHFTFVCEAAAQGIKDVSVKFNSPVIFCVLTDDHLQQSIDRSGGKHGNKGVEAAVAAIKMLGLKDRILMAK
ncbi:MAG: 6,7-dimethyl-8-ribityllumazine synthase [Flavobacteriales bacterium]|nr:6,7-dimethyl-8-ribityllumazine synthase [Flavobacteriales bacterium]